MLLQAVSGRGRVLGQAGPVKSVGSGPRPDTARCCAPGTATPSHFPPDHAGSEPEVRCHFLLGAFRQHSRWNTSAYPHSRSGLERRLQPAPAARERSGTARPHLPSQRKPPGARHREPQLPRALPRVSAGSEPEVRCHFLFGAFRQRSRGNTSAYPHSRSGLERRLQPAPAARERSGTGRSHLPSQRNRPVLHSGNRPVLRTGNRPVLRTGNRNSLTRCRAFRRAANPRFAAIFFLARSDNAADGTPPPTPTAKAAWNAGFSRHPLRESAAEQEALIFLHSGNRPVLGTGNRNSLARCRAFRRVPIRCRFLLVQGGLAPLSHFPPDQAGSEPEVRCHFLFGAFR